MSGQNRPAGAIVVGLDDSASGRAALRFALEEGLARDATVEVVTMWVLDGTVRDRITEEMMRDEAHVVRLRQGELLAEVAHGLARRPRIAQLVVHGSGGGALVEAARDAALLVVGSGRKGPLTRAVLGSVSAYCVRHAPVPVVVVPDPARAATVPAEEPVRLDAPGHRG